MGDRWADPGLGEWDVRALVGHTSRSLLTVETYLGVLATAVDLDSPAAYYLVTRSISAGPEVDKRGRAAGEALGADPANAVAAIAERVLPLLDDADGTELVTTVVGGMRLTAYLPTRTFELVVHALDLVAALGLVGTHPRAPRRRACGSWPTWRSLGGWLGLCCSLPPAVPHQHRGSASSETAAPARIAAQNGIRDQDRPRTRCS